MVSLSLEEVSVEDSELVLLTLDVDPSLENGSAAQKTGRVGAGVTITR